MPISSFAEQPADAPALSAAQAEIESANQAFIAAIQPGPRSISLAGQAVLKLPEGYGFVPEGPARRLMEAMGNQGDDTLKGTVISTKPGDDSDWLVVIRYEDTGYIKDDDARNWNADELMNSIRTGTEESNAERRERGLPELEVIGWVEKPQYDATTNRLVWSLSARDKGAAREDHNSINYNTLALGREGYFSLNLITDLATVNERKSIATTLLGNLDFDGGKRYADFNADTDKVAEYGLAALVAGVAAKKLGLLALAAAFAVKFAKIIGVVVVVGLASLRKVFTGKSDTPPPNNPA